MGSYAEAYHQATRPCPDCGRRMRNDMLRCSVCNVPYICWLCRVVMAQPFRLCEPCERVMSATAEQRDSPTSRVVRPPWWEGHLARLAALAALGVPLDPERKVVS